MMVWFSAPVLSLQVLLGVPVTVVDDAGVGRCQIDAQAASPGVTLELKDEGVNCDVLPGAQQEDAVGGVLVEPVDVGLSVQEVHPSVYTNKILISAFLFPTPPFQHLPRRQNFHFLRLQ